MAKKLKINILIVFLLSMLSKGLGFVRDILLVNKMGVTVSTDGYLGAVSIVEFLIVVTGLQAFFSIATTTFADLELEQHQKRQYYTSFLLLQSLIAFLVSTFAIFFPISLVSIVLPGLSQSAKEYAATLLRILALNVAFISIHKSLNSILGVYKLFFLQNIWLLFLNLIVITCIVINPDEKVLFSLAVATVTSYGVFILLQMLILKGKGVFFEFTETQVILMNWKHILSLYLPLLLVTGFESISGMVDKIIASFCEEGIITSLTLASNLTFFTVSALLFPVMRVVFPEFSILYQKKMNMELQGLFNRTLELIILVFLPISLFIVFFSSEIVNGIYLRDSFSTQNALIVSNILKIYGVSLIFNVFYMLPIFLLQATHNNKYVGKLGAISFIINIVSSVLFSYFWGYIGIPLGTLVSFFFYSVFTFRFVDKHLKFRIKKMNFVIFALVVIISVLVKVIIAFLLDLGITYPFISKEEHLNKLVTALLFFPFYIICYFPFFLKIQKGNIRLKG